MDQVVQAEQQVILVRPGQLVQQDLMDLPVPLDLLGSKVQLEILAHRDPLAPLE